MSWVLDGDLTKLAGLLLEGSERHPEGWAPVDALTPGDVMRRFGLEDSALAALSWSWISEKDGGHAANAALEGLALVSTAFGARVPLAEVPRFVGKGLTRAGCLAFGLEVVAPLSVVAAAPLSPPRARAEEMYVSTQFEIKAENAKPGDPSRRKFDTACRSGKVRGAFKQSRNWRCTRAAWEQYGREAAIAAKSHRAQPVDEELAELVRGPK